jgi:hypothetical protein
MNGEIYPMKVTVPGKTPIERLTNLTKRVIAVPKDEVEHEERKWRKLRAKHRKSDTK